MGITRTQKSPSLSPSNDNQLESPATAHSPEHRSKMPPSDRDPIVDQAEANAFFPSPFSLTQYVTSKTDFDGANYPNKYTGGKWRILLIATGNPPVEMLLPMLHLDAAGFDIDIAT